jgi:threonine aldolase
MHKAGILAAAGIYALRNNLARLAEDHERAARLAEGLADLPGIEVENSGIESNIVYFDVFETGITASELLDRVAAYGVRFKRITETRLRAVTHLDIRDDHVPRAVAAVRAATSAREVRAAHLR